MKGPMTTFIRDDGYQISVIHGKDTIDQVLGFQLHGAIKNWHEGEPQPEVEKPEIKPEPGSWHEVEAGRYSAKLRLKEIGELSFSFFWAAAKWLIAVTLFLGMTLDMFRLLVKIWSGH